MAVVDDRVRQGPEEGSPGEAVSTRHVPWVPVRRAALVTYFAVLVGSILINGIPLDRVGLTLWILVGLSIASLGKGWRAWGRIMLDWLPFQGVLLAYDYSYGIAGRYGSGGFPHEGDTNVVGLPLHASWPVHADEFLFGGTLPNQWVQEHFASSTSVPWYTAIITLTYCSHFVVTPLVAAGLWVRAREQFRVWVWLVLGLAVSGMATYFIFPMSPPWLASQQGLISGAPVDRLTGEGWSVLGLHIANQVLSDSQDRSNPVAAMPSLHMAFATLVAGYFMFRTRRLWLRLLLPVYPLAMAFSLVYAGEHYVIDELAGVVFAAVVLAVWRVLHHRSLRTEALRCRPVASADSARQVAHGQALLGTSDRPMKVVESRRGQADPVGTERH